MIKIIIYCKRCGDVSCSRISILLHKINDEVLTVTLYVILLLLIVKI